MVEKYQKEDIVIEKINDSHKKDIDGFISYEEDLVDFVKNHRS